MTTCNICNNNTASNTRTVQSGVKLEVCTACDHFTDDRLSEALDTFSKTTDARALFTFNFSGMNFIGVKVNPIEPSSQPGIPS